MGRDRWTTRLTVEDCAIYLDVEAYRRAGTFDCAPGTTGTISWTSPSGERLGEIEYSLFRDTMGLTIRVRNQYQRLNSVLTLVQETEIPIVATRPHLGGSRLWFECGCGRRVRRLYLPPGQQTFGCRGCHYLTYTSVQAHDHRKNLLLKDPTALAAVVRSENPRLAALGVGALALHFERTRRRQCRKV
jgi:hypothetical protein